MRVDARNKSGADFFRRHFVTPPTENVLLYKCVNIQHNFNMYESLSTTHGFQFKLNTKFMIEFSQKEVKLWCYPTTYFLYRLMFCYMD